MPAGSWVQKMCPKMDSSELPAPSASQKLLPPPPLGGSHRGDLECLPQEVHPRGGVSLTLKLSPITVIQGDGLHSDEHGRRRPPRRDGNKRTGPAPPASGPGGTPAPPSSRTAAGCGAPAQGVACDEQPPYPRVGEPASNLFPVRRLDLHSRFLL